MTTRKVLSIVLSGLLLASLIPAVTASATPVCEQCVVVQEPGPQNQLEFGSDIIVFKSKPGGECDLGEEVDWDIWGYDMSSHQLFPIAEDDDTQNNPSVYGDIVVWMSVDPDDGEHDIFGMDLSTGDRFPICLREGEQCNPFVWGNWVIYVDQSMDDGRNYALYKYNLNTGAESLVNPGEYDQYCPALNGTYAAYRSNVTTPTTHNEIWATNIFTGETSVCETNTAYKYEVSMGNKNIVVWSEYIDGWSRRQIVAYDIDTGTRSVLGTDAVGVYAYNPDVYDDIVVWSDNRDGDYAIYMHDLKTGEETRLSTADGDQERPRIWENTVAWASCGSATGTSKDISAVQLECTQYEIEGATRYSTAVETSRRGFPGGADTVVIASGEQWPDALAASALAGAVNGPVLLTAGDSIPDETMQEIFRLGVKNAYLVGGTAALSEQVEQHLNILVGGPVKRLGGVDRIETSEIIAAEVSRLMGEDFEGTAFLSTGMNYADSLAASPLAAANGWPIFLADPVGPRQSTLKAMDDLGIEKLIILGGEAAMASKTEVLVDKSAIVAGASMETTRLAGADRFGTAVVVAEYGCDEAGLDWEGLALTNGYNFPDALAGGPLQGISGSVVLLTDPNSLSGPTAAKISGVKDEISSVRYFGGPGAISSTVRTAVTNILE